MHGIFRYMVPPALLPTIPLAWFLVFVETPFPCIKQAASLNVGKGQFT